MLIIKDITLMDSYMFYYYEKHIPVINNSWWLKDQGQRPSSIKYINKYGSINEMGDYSTSSRGVRPLLIVKHLDAVTGDQVELFSLKWTVLDKHHILCDTVIDNYIFDENFDGDRCEYISFTTSKIRQYLYLWLKTNKSKCSKTVHIKNETELSFLFSFCEKYGLVSPYIFDLKMPGDWDLVFTPYTEWKQIQLIATKEAQVMSFSEFCDYISERYYESSLAASNISEHIIRKIE